MDMKEFNTSGPNIQEQHYTIFRKDLIDKGVRLVEKSKYFTIWAPRQTGKSTYFRQLANELETRNYKVTHVNLENYQTSTVISLFDYLLREIKENWNIKFKCKTFENL
ncbi:MAG: hypothetical protein U9R19_07295, partial [Bacteroidota bacterium]|nr:hypothetical protein [Bacteroidota bacterium]